LSFNYTSDGYFLVALGAIFLCTICLIVDLIFIVGYSYINDITECKGRKTRKVFPNNLMTYSELSKDRHAAARIAAGDPNYTKFLVKKERASAHH
jgi:hypothetical protein